ncbi:MAG: MgtC/SapB family protein [Bacteroidales bacterium]|nr:MgtC/SapB family protein [Bacteroidales bacterium]
MTWNFIIRLLAAGLLGGLIGLERELRAKEAGVRTHFIVALGSALFMIISQYAFEGSFDHARVAAQVVSGIGFIGAGVIIFQRNVVRGITTAAGLWVAAAIGLACGSGMFYVAIAAAIMTIICLETMHFVTSNHGEKIFTVTLSPVDGDSTAKVLDSLRSEGFDIETISLSDGKAVIRVHAHQKDYLDKVGKVLTLFDKFKIEIS